MKNERKDLLCHWKWSGRAWRSWQLEDLQELQACLRIWLLHPLKQWSPLKDERVFPKDKRK